LILCVAAFAVLVLRKDVEADGTHFKTPTWPPLVVLGVVLFGATLRSSGPSVFAAPTSPTSRR
jgi:hypothetical protein